MMKKLALAQLVAALSLAGCHGASAKEQPAAAAEVPAVSVIHPQEKLGHAASSASGRVRSVHEATLSARVSGPIARVHVGVGDRVRAGQPLVEIQSTAAAGNAAAARASRDAAAADLRLAEMELERVQKLAAEGALPRAQLDQAQATTEAGRARLASLKANISIAESTLRDHVVRAPFDGVVTACPAQLGESVSAVPPTALVTVMDLDDLELRIDVPEGAMTGLAVGATVTASVSPAGKPFAARVKALGAAVDTRTRTVEVILSIPTDKRSPGDEIRPGALVSVQLAAAAALTGPFVPKQAVRSNGDGSFVWVIEDGVAHKKPVRVEPMREDLLRVLEGLRGPEAVVLAADDRITEGARVRAVE
ncbi:membrane fusion protein [Minicystis rosea]|nr:membrane fusion protein [Minicystis rosea]